MVVKCTGAYRDPKEMLVSSHLALVDHPTPFGLASLELLISAPRGLSQMHKYEILK
jgi:hypothetical protein